MTSNESTCLDFLHLVIGKLLSCKMSSLEPRYETVKSYVTEDFDKTDLAAPVGNIKNIERIVSSEDNAILIDFIDSEGDRYRAKFVVQASSSGWRIESLKFECPGCFGVGINNDETCILCGGKGWGAT